MSKQCDRCGRGSLRGASRSHSNIKTIRRQEVNLQWRRIDGRRLRLCTRCLKTLAKAAVV